MGRQEPRGPRSQQRGRAWLLPDGFEAVIAGTRGAQGGSGAQGRCQKRPNIWQAVKDAELAKEKEKTEFAIAPVRRTNAMTIVAMPMVDFLKLLSKVYQDGKEMKKIDTFAEDGFKSDQLKSAEN